MIFFVYSRFVGDIDSWAHNHLGGPYDLEEKEMYFLRLPCEKATHSKENFLEKVPIAVRNTSMVSNLIIALV